MEDSARQSDRSEPVEASLMRSEPRGDLMTGTICVVAALLGCIVFVPVWVYVPDSVAGTWNSPAVMPQAMFVLLGIFGALLAIRGFWAGGVASRPSGDAAVWRRVGAMLGICFAYLLGILLIGLPIASGLALAATLLLFGERRWIVATLVAVLVPLLLWFFFVKVAAVPMPDPVLKLADSRPGIPVWNVSGGEASHAV